MPRQTLTPLDRAEIARCDALMRAHPNAVFVFGSNLEGRHGKGAALAARDLYGAISGQGYGLMGRAYAVPTKVTPSQVRSLPEIQRSVRKAFLVHVARPDYEWVWTRVACGLSECTDHDVAGVLRGLVVPAHIHLPPIWLDVLQHPTP